MPNEPILLGVIGRPHGVRGHVHVHSYTAEPADLACYGVLSDDTGRRFTLCWKAAGVAEVREILGGAVRPVTDRAAAERLVNMRLYVDRSSLPAPDPDEFYLADLIGLAAETAGGETLGKVLSVHDYGAGPSLEISRGPGTVLLPFTRACVPLVDVRAGRMVVALPAEVVVEGALA